MEDQEQAQNPAVEENSVSESPAEETTTSVPTETEGSAEQSDSAAEETQEGAERKPSRAERRIRQLSAQAKQVSQSSQLPNGPQQSPQFPQYFEGQEVSPQQLQADVVQTAQAIADLTVQQRLAQAEAVSSLNTDTKVLPAENPELNPDSAEYLPELEKAIAEEYQSKAFRVTGYRPDGSPILALDPSVRLSDIAGRHLEVARAAAKKSSANMKNAVAQTADETAIRPGSDAPSEKSPDNMSDKEYMAWAEKKFGVVRR